MNDPRREADESELARDLYEDSVELEEGETASGIAPTDDVPAVDEEAFYEEPGPGNDDILERYGDWGS